MAAQAQSTTNGHDPRALTVQNIPQGPVEIPGSESTTVLTLTRQQIQGQALEQYEYDPGVIDQAVMLGDMKKMSGEMRLSFYRAVCLSVGVNPLTQPFTPLERQDKTIWLYPNSTCAQQLAKLHRVGFSDVTRRHFTIADEPMYEVTLVASLPDGRSIPSLAVTSLTKKKKVHKGNWPDGNPKFVDALDDDGEPILIPLRGEGLANAIKKTDTQALRRATLALVGLGWMANEDGGQTVPMNLQTGAFQDPARLRAEVHLLDNPVEQAKSVEHHIADLMGQPAPVAHAPMARQSPPPALHVAADHTRKTVGDIHTLHTDHGRDENWIDRYWDKILKRLQVPIVTKLSDEQLDGLYAEAVKVYAKQAAEKAETEASTPGVSLVVPDDSEGTLGDPGAPGDGHASVVASGAWRNMLDGLAGDLSDATLAQESQSLLEDADASDEAGQAMITRVLQSIEAALEEEGQPF